MAKPESILKNEQRKRRHAKGYCTDCGRVRKGADLDYWFCADCRARNSRRHARKLRRDRAAGVPPKKQIKTDSIRHYMKLYYHELVKQRFKLGICQRCGGPRPITVKRRWNCARCREKLAAKEAARRRARGIPTAEERRALGWNRNQSAVQRCPEHLPPEQEDQEQHDQ